MNVVRPADEYYHRQPLAHEIEHLDHELSYIDSIGVRHALYSLNDEHLVEFAWYEPPVMPALQLEAVRE